MLYEALMFAAPDRAEVVFGNVITDGAGQLAIDPANEIPNITGQRFGWVARVRKSSRPVRWKESITAPTAEAWNDVDRFSAFGVLSHDGRTVTTHGTAVPLDGAIGSYWVIADTDPPGSWRLKVEVEGHVEPTVFDFALSNRLGSCPFWLTKLDWWWARWMGGNGGSESRDISAELLERIGVRLWEHGFEVTTDIQDAYWKVSINASVLRSDSRIAHGYASMRAIADFEGRARRYDYATVGDIGTVEASMLFEAPAENLDESARELADYLARSVSSHARMMCEDWASGQLREEARLEAIRRELVAEIERVRGEREDRAQQKRLLIEVDPAR